MNEFEEFAKFMQENVAQIQYRRCHIFCPTNGTWQVISGFPYEILLETDNFIEALNCLKENG